MLSSNVYILLLIIYATGLRTFIYNRKHLVNILLSLEYIAITMFILLVVSVVKTGIDIYMTLFFLTLAVCEGRLGLGLLVGIARSHGGDLIRALDS